MTKLQIEERQADCPLPGPGRNSQPETRLGGQVPPVQAPESFTLFHSREESVRLKYGPATHKIGAGNGDMVLDHGSHRRIEKEMELAKAQKPLST